METVDRRCNRRWYLAGRVINRAVATGACRLEVPRESDIDQKNVKNAMKSKEGERVRVQRRWWPIGCFPAGAGHKGTKQAVSVCNNQMKQTGSTLVVGLKSNY